MVELQGRLNGKRLSCLSKALTTIEKNPFSYKFFPEDEIEKKSCISLTIKS
jgi:hypothetical protein